VRLDYRWIAAGDLELLALEPEDIHMRRPLQAWPT